jgi:hypothetical protein
MSDLELDPRTVELISRVVSNTSTKLKRAGVLQIAYHAFNNSQIAQDNFQTKISTIWSVKKILFIIGLLKTNLGSVESYLMKVNIESKLARLSLKLDKIVKEYDLSYDNLKEKLNTNSNEYLQVLANNDIKSYIGLLTATYTSSGLIKKFESIKLLESNIDIKHAQFIDIYLSVLFIKKVFEQYLEIIDINNNKDIFLKTFQSLEKIKIFISFLVSNNDFIKDYAYSSADVQEKIRENVTSKYVDAIMR